ncbi:hypothetical protein Thiosp_02252 [Thiorhodovibrio litoralis]|nr:hypothetical protein Thiosp_02252 [Thiorhodovibrio litoralis]
MSWWHGKALNCLQFNIGNFRLWISAFCVFEKNSKGRYTEEHDEGVKLSAPAFTGLIREHSPFGRYKDGAFVLAAA